MATAAATTSEPVTVVVTRRVKAGHEAAYEAWLADLTTRAKTLDGYLGTTIQKPAPGAPRDYTSVFRFASVETLRAFEASDLRREALAAVLPHVEADAVWQTQTGLEFWFTPPPGTVVAQPSRFRMALVLIVTVFTLVLSIGRVVGLVIGEAPQPVRLFVTIVIEVFLLTYVVMPRLTRVLARWIYPTVRAG